MINLQNLLGAVLCATAVFTTPVGAGATQFQTEVLPLLQHYCYDCHGEGADKGDFQLDAHRTPEMRIADQEHWMGVMENLRSNIMPPPKKAQPTPAEIETINKWISTEVFEVDLENPDPGRVTIRRLNRKEYQHSIQDLLGVTFDPRGSFPPDDTGYGFDTIGDVLSISPLLMEKYLKAAEAIAREAVPDGGARIPVIEWKPDHFPRFPRDEKGNASWLSFQWPVETRRDIWINHEGRYRLELRFHIEGSKEATENTGDIILQVNGREVGRSTYGWDNRKMLIFSKEVSLKQGKNTLALLTEPKKKPEKGQGFIYAHGDAISLTGPLDGSVQKYPSRYDAIFPHGTPNLDSKESRREVAATTLRRIASRAFRRPVDDATLQRLMNLYREVGEEGEGSFEDGITHALTAILVSPRFLLRAETQSAPDDSSEAVHLDQFALASRLSYFLWSSLPDEILLEKAGKGELQNEGFTKEISRLLKDRRAQRFVDNFTGQWLQTRDTETVPLDVSALTGIQNISHANRVFNPEIRMAMREETNHFFSYILKEGRPATELLTANYTFANEALANFYKIPWQGGREFAKIDLPEDFPRGGLLTQGSIQVATSNPSRTSPVKRGLFILENILGTPAPSAPADVPEIDNAQKKLDENATMREVMAAHQEEGSLCISCHARMDPLGLAMEIYNPLGQYLKHKASKLDTSGKLLTGEPFSDVHELQEVIATKRKADFLRCLTEKLMTYALGRGLDYYDAPTIDRIVSELLAEGEGHASLRSMIHKVIWSHAFRKRRGDGSPHFSASKSQ